jgi:Flp pilus assembly pilin Flp
VRRLIHAAWNLSFWKDTRGQDLIEYALMAGFVAVSAAAIVPGATAGISTIFTKVQTVLTSASGS